MENWLSGIIGAVIIILILTIGSCSVVIDAQDNNAMKEMIKNGAEPIDAYCAVRGVGSNPACIIRASRHP